MIVGKSKESKKLATLIESVSMSDVSVLIQGESGSGKELVARSIHDNSNRRDGPFIAVNCGAIPTDLIESQLFGHKKGAFTGAISDFNGKIREAHKGTLFLDEIGDMPMDMQVKMLRVLQEKVVTPIGSLKDVPVDFRVVAASHKNLEEEIEEKRFRLDLFYRLNVVPLHVPPLRKRADEIPDLFAWFASQFSEQESPIELTDESLLILQAYAWPGNVRELSNLVQRLAVLYPGRTLDLKQVDADMLPEGILGDSGLGRDGVSEASDLENTDADGDTDEFESIVMMAQGFGSPIDEKNRSLKQILSRVEQDLITKALLETGGNVSQSAKLLRMQRTTLIERIKKYDLSVA
ncbi:MAG TPA: sigma-54-dependent Fis family transcriptional regulator [Gammaproteobacteria bacterium]|nr:sigma-54-dependent Fis family transcriptional regulator [Gammaproteobacteria bacterium]